ncbi:MAG TPA: hypothetical protein VFY14_02525 [Streptomyces sp.]|nr:hypothetical protein [Streptomyces sp.]
MPMVLLGGVRVPVPAPLLELSPRPDPQRRQPLARLPSLLGELAVGPVQGQEPGTGGGGVEQARRIWSSIVGPAHSEPPGPGRWAFSGDSDGQVTSSPVAGSSTRESRKKRVAPAGIGWRSRSAARSPVKR